MIAVDIISSQLFCSYELYVFPFALGPSVVILKKSDVKTFAGLDAETRQPWQLNPLAYMDL